LGPITVDPDAQDRHIGRALMEHTLERTVQQGAAGVRLLQAAYHNRSLSLYAKLGFDVREPFAVMQGHLSTPKATGSAVRSATVADLGQCNAVCTRVHGHDRDREVRDAIAQGGATVVERAGRITGYTTGIGYIGHAVADSNDDLAALISAAENFLGPGFLVPMRNTALLRWCLRHQLRVVYMMNLMSIGRFQEPRGAFLASVLY
jgi:GNAT acetyltransferase-like protein